MIHKYCLLTLLLCCMTALNAQKTFSDTTTYYFSDYLDQDKRYFSGSTDTLMLDSMVLDTAFYSLVSTKQTQPKALVKMQNQRVFYKGSSDVHYQKIYDFNLQPGDTLDGYKLYKIFVIDSVKQYNVSGDTFRVQYTRARISVMGVYPMFRFVNGIGSLEAGIPYWQRHVFETGRILLGICDHQKGLQWTDEDPLQFGSGQSCDQMDSVVRRLDVPDLSYTANVKVYPNPVLSVLHIECSEPCSVSLYDMQGRCVRDAAPYLQSQTINIDGLAGGSYILRIQTGTTVICRNIIKPEDLGQR